MGVCGDMGKRRGRGGGSRQGGSPSPAPSFHKLLSFLPSCGFPLRGRVDVGSGWAELDYVWLPFLLFVAGVMFVSAQHGERKSHSGKLSHANKSSLHIYFKVQF
jgi:hypothetical protein